MTHLRSALASLIITATGAGFTKPFVLLKLDFLTSAYNKCMALVKKSSFSKANQLSETGPRYANEAATHGSTCTDIFMGPPRQDVLHRTLDTRHWTLREGRRQGGGGVNRARDD